jgi:hypothetical protein
MDGGTSEGTKQLTALMSAEATVWALATFDSCRVNGPEASAKVQEGCP